MEIRVDKRGKIIISKEIRDKYNIVPGVELGFDSSKDYCYGVMLKFYPKHVCSACGKALTDDLIERGACPECTPIKRESVKIY